MTKVLFGRVAVLADELPEQHPSAVLVLASSQRHTAPVLRALQAYETRVFAGARVHVPIEVVEAAEAELGGANVIVAIGGGSPIGLGKALRLRAAEAGRELCFVAVPTTYAGSERTSMYGITRGRDKQTGRDERVRPQLVVADLELTLDLPIVLTVQSLLNAVAHVASITSTAGTADPEAVTAVREVVVAIDRLITHPHDRDARSQAMIFAGACASAFDRGKAGVQHAFAHLLGGAFGVDHAPLHAILLPRFLAAFPAVRAELALDGDALLALLGRAGAPTTLGALGITPAALEEVLATRPELPGDIARAAL